MRFVAWLAGLVVILVGAVVYRPLSDFGAENWLIVATIASIWSMVLWNSTIVDRAVVLRHGDSRGLFTVLLLVATSNKGLLRSAQRSQP
ncbi:hypothetical protein GR200_30965 [Rhizobium leguminosarum]|uniref:hypothetical protein n=1 Tax=Rhizobium leguminosarum TaxID=384 RepID=UPI0013BBA128|nr:hypothetical protein [Rhizobium leguminosarum]NEI59453.1 hypothetical protein [Rhizobium leguminosarum]NEI88293.1 hypothetical protein [Rhizobium leguminosarum]